MKRIGHTYLLSAPSFVKKDDRINRCLYVFPYINNMIQIEQYDTDFKNLFKADAGIMKFSKCAWFKCQSDSFTIEVQEEIKRCHALT